MNNDDIIRMAREAGFERLGHTDNDWVCYPEDIERFAALVSSAEREACAKVCDDDQSEAGEWSAGAHVGGYFAVRIRARGQA